ncbi:methylated-DNA--[protein]-cysteine S-methyltransferase [Caulifigura coniformis]|uniref:methylated-DNA--[protein]-cysteine S-methyltransferase n=1 Tax=Caulifigura coniformis TaxID=2527983 RepID=UPI0018D2355F|nr:MGMT family protein [Caulifigura coniformis]
MGWVGMAGEGLLLHSLVLGHSSQAECLARFQDLLASGAVIDDWNPELRTRVQRFLAGDVCDDFRDVETAVTESTPFASRVIAAVRRIPAGKVLSYTEVAAQSGSPRASRAVGNIMARNRIPLVIPCHRVVASGGRLGGYSSPQGLSMKTRLLQLEGAVAATP